MNKSTAQIKRITAARLAYGEATTTVETAWQAYQLGVDDYYDGKITRPQLEQLLQAARLADCVKSDAYKTWGEAQNAEDEDCTCKPTDTMLCPTCRKAQAQKEIEFK